MGASKNHSLVLALIGAIASCAPLEQAPLVYSSKSVVGVDLSATTTEQPGLSINIGYKQVDAAYVPVAVAKSCDREFNQENYSQTKMQEKSDEIDCTDKIYALLPIEGNNSVEDSRDENGQIEEAKKRLEEFKGLGAARDNAEKTLSDVLTRKNQIESAIKNFNERYTKDKNNKFSDDQINSEHNLKVNELNAIRVEEDSANKALNAARHAVANFDVTKLLDAFSLAGLDNTKKDAYSVFGSFDANTKAVAAVGGTGEIKEEIKGGTGLVLGKVFSTGVASQNLTEGMRKYYERDGEARVETAKSQYNCLNQSMEYLKGFKSQLDLTKEAERQRYSKMYESILALCTLE